MPSEANLLLVADDNETGRYRKSRLLRRAGYDVLEAETGSETLRLVAERRPRLVILDVQMPEVDGWEVCRRIKTDETTASVLVLQTSATFVSEEDTVRALEGGADACLTEPIETAVLLATVKALLRTRQAEDAVREVLGREQEARSVAEAANRTKDEFLATLSHELRSPMGAILTWVTLLRSGRMDESRVAHALEVIERNTRLQVKLIEDLLDVSRIISGKMRLDVTLVELAVVVDAALDSLRTAAAAKSVRLVTTIDPTVGPVAGDAARLQQVLWNLLSNAVKFTPTGGTVEVRIDAEAADARIQVTDTGRGIAAEFLPHIFERFLQADSSSTRGEGGLGLGLAIVRHLVELHGGTVEAHSRGAALGATFTVRLPMPAARAAVTGEGAARFDRAVAPTPVLRRLDGLRILVLDDEADTREAIAAVLEDCGAQITAVSTVREALALHRGGAFNLTISDIAMPREDGFAFIRGIRAQAGDPSPVVLALTAYGSPEDQRRILEAGFDAYLSKPVDAKELVTAVRRLAATPDSKLA